MSLTVKTFPKGPLGENTYLVIDEDTGLKAVIDPGYYGEDIICEIGNAADLKFIMLTHGHFDHFFSVKKYLERFETAKFVAPEKDKFLLGKDWNKDYLSMGMQVDMCPEADIYVSEGDVIELGNTTFGFIETPGHTEGGVCITADNIIFSGDTLFRLSVGNTSFETGDWNTLYLSIKNKLYELDDETVVYTGHGSPTTIGYEKRANPFV